MVSMDFYGAVAQVIPMLVLAIALQTREVDGIAERTKRERGRADAAWAPVIALIKAMAEGERPGQKASEYEQVQVDVPRRRELTVRFRRRYMRAARPCP